MIIGETILISGGLITLLYGGLGSGYVVSVRRMTGEGCGMTDDFPAEQDLT